MATSFECGLECSPLDTGLKMIFSFSAAVTILDVDWRYWSSPCHKLISAADRYLLRLWTCYAGLTFRTRRYLCCCCKIAPVGLWFLLQAVCCRPLFCSFADDLCLVREVTGILMLELYLTLVLLSVVGKIATAILHFLTLACNVWFDQHVGPRRIVCLAANVQSLKWELYYSFSWFT